MRRAADGVDKIVRRFVASRPEPRISLVATARSHPIRHLVALPAHTPARETSVGADTHDLGYRFACRRATVRFSSTTPGSEQSERAKSRYLEREGMIRETQKAVRQLYKEGMYQVMA